MMKLLIFGSTGDLVKRKILPALQEFNLEIIALGRKDLTHEQYMSHIDGRQYPDNFKAKIKYHQIDFDNLSPRAFLPLLDKKQANFFFISMPPAFTPSIIKLLGKIKERKIAVRALIEKPFGSNYEEARKLKELISELNLREDVLLSDHYLFKDEIIKLKEKENFSSLKIVAIERLGLEGRAGYYDSIGAVKDVIQSHFFSVLFKLLPSEKIKNQEISRIYFRKAQYNTYVKELGKPSKTETFAHLIFQIDNKKVEFITGKGFKDKITFIEIDGKRKDIEDKTNAYRKAFKNFLENKKELFPTKENALLSWRIIEKLTSGKSPLFLYNKGSEFNYQNVKNHPLK